MSQGTTEISGRLWGRLDGSDWLVPGALVVGLACGVLIAVRGLSIALLFAAGVGICALLLIRQDVLVAVLAAATAILVDWYPFPGVSLYQPDFAIIIAVVLLGVIFLFQSSERPWVALPYPLLWIALLALGVYPLLHGVDLTDSVKYYTSVLGNSAVFYLLGIQIGRNARQVRQLLRLLTGLATLIALHSIILTRTGVFLFASPRLDQYLGASNDFTLAYSQAIRAGSFLLNPDWNGVFLATMALVSTGMLFESPTRASRIVHGLETAIILVALLFTYSTASWLAAGVGFTAFIWLVGSARYRAYLLGILGVVGAGMVALFPRQVELLLIHSTQPQELTLREAVWQTALQIIRAHPLTGLGLGLSTYLAREEPYRVPAQILQFAQPHNSYLELAAMGGVPLLLAFLLCLGSALWRALRAHTRAPAPQRALLGGVIAAALVLSFNSLSINAWTLAPLATLAWLMLGSVSSPALDKSFRLPTSAPAPRARRQTAYALAVEGSALG